MDKATLLTRIVAALETDMEVLRRAAQTAYETATAEENIAENKYDTLGLEASYLATGQARRTAEIRQALLIYQQLVLRDYDPARGIQIGSLVILEDEAGAQRQVFLGPEAAGLKIGEADALVTVITPRSPLGQQLVGKKVDDEVSLGAQLFFIVEVA
ncbi:MULTISPECIES: GreA/GreB family elongation factor [Pseudomonas]|jgi:transcription elongation GreA/GreB family factor|uniref:GreA/GreB family elongation factor n=1 Tax=Pseudomonas putida (strain W619) TaxID=390235 RepID=B1J4U8_PSEPW|nr:MULTISPECIES: GreA/GreB family elongation factor [Pseudomonas]MDH1576488.1 GreA/GreB family elongation factor [Pseudomonas sp. GD03746]QQE85501.1 GreA/GreB family elongation factor [Pseudomonas putida]UTL82515.1 GreA/GreB family elongation factor [Pseudomonas putida]HEN8714517.1 GreA/GreB family elongation factor [Pseudomonas putida]HEN8719784.1 GreA/GreB family elongation factor [Pseudomonas putida]